LRAREENAMTPQEKELITTLLGRLKQAGGQPKDPEAEALIRQGLAEQPDAPYYLVQTVLIQEMALNQAQQRISELERQCAQAAQPQKPTSFLGGLFGAGAGRGDQPQGGGTVPSSGPWSRAPQPQSSPPGAGPQPYGQPGYPQPGYPQPGYGGQPMMGMAQGGSGFLRSAAATAAGIAGGALLFQGIQSMFGPHGGGVLGGMAQQPGLSETVTNNYYGSDQGGADQGGAPADLQHAADQGGYAPDPGYADQNVAADPGFASDQDFASESGFSDDSDLV
jgi:hypothetical protein